MNSIKNNINKKKILILAPHTDDGELGCGASISRFLSEQNEVFYAAFSICEESVPQGFPKNILEKEAREATCFLGIDESRLIIKKYPVRRFPEFRQQILEDLVQLRKDIEPNIVFMPSSFDIHQDHQTIYLEGRRAYKNCSILGYEFMWNNFSFETTGYIIVSEKDIENKIRAINIYKSQEHRFYAKEKLVKGLANYRGLQISREYAEAFEIIRWII